jgi:hypothetical protein
MKRRLTVTVYSSWSVWKIMEKISNYSLVDSLIVARCMEKLVDRSI